MNSDKRSKAVGIFPVSGTYSHPSGTAVQTAFTITLNKPSAVTIYLDAVNLTENTVFYVLYQIDAVNYRIIDNLPWTTAMDDGVFFRKLLGLSNFRVQIQSIVAEGAARNIPYQYFIEA